MNNAPSSKEDPARNEGMGSCNSALGHLRLGNEYPYDADEDENGDYCPVQHADDWSFRAARGVLADLTDRRDIKMPFELVDHSGRVEIVAALAGIIREAQKSIESPDPKKWFPLESHHEIVDDLDRTVAKMSAEITKKRAELARLRRAISKQNDDICQTLGAALGYPRYCDDQKTFPGATETSGVCVGEHVAESLADEAAREILARGSDIVKLKADVAKLRLALSPFANAWNDADVGDAVSVSRASDYGRAARAMDETK